MIRLRETSTGEEMAARSERLKQAREYAGYGSARSAAAAKGWPESTYRSHENGARGFGPDDARRYSQAFGVRFDWLYYGKSRMLEDEGAPKPQPEAAKTAADAASATLPLENISFPRRKLPVYGYARGGPEGALILDGTIVAQVDCLPGLETVPDAYGVYVTGESMEPRYFAGETVYVHPYKSPRRGDFVVVQVQREGEPTIGYVKQFIGYADGDLILSQFNPPAECRFPQGIVKAVHLIVGTRTS